MWHALFKPLIGLRDEDMDIKTMITNSNTAVTDAVKGNAQEKAVCKQRCSQPLR